MKAVVIPDKHSYFSWCLLATRIVTLKEDKRGDGCQIGALFSRSPPMKNKPVTAELAAQDGWTVWLTELNQSSAGEAEGEVRGSLGTGSGGDGWRRWK